MTPDENHALHYRAEEETVMERKLSRRNGTVCRWFDREMLVRARCDVHLADTSAQQGLPLHEVAVTDDRCEPGLG